MKIWILYYSILFLHISISYNFICLIIFFFFYYSIQFYFKKYFLNNTDGVTDDLNLSIFSRELEKIYCICHNQRRTYADEIISLAYFQQVFFWHTFFICKTIGFY
jgi:hypothetical protein